MLDDAIDLLARTDSHDRPVPFRVFMSDALTRHPDLVTRHWRDGGHRWGTLGDTRCWLRRVRV